MFQLRGALDSRASDALGASLSTQLDPIGSIRRVILDLSRVGVVEAVAVGMLSHVEGWCSSRTLRLCLAESPQQLIQLLREAGLGRHFRHHLTVREAVAEGYTVQARAELTRLLPAAEIILQAIAAEHLPSEGCRAGWSTQSPSRTEALSALYRVWDALADHLQRPLGAHHTGAGHRTRTVRLPETDMPLLTHAALALKYPTADLQDLVVRLSTGDHDPDCIAHLLTALTPADEPAAAGPAAAAPSAGVPRG